MRFDVLTIFPDLLESPLKEGIIRRAVNDGKIQIAIHNIRDYALDKHAMTDDRPFGGGEGMVMKPEPLAAAVQDVRRQAPDQVRHAIRLLASHAGQRLVQEQHLGIGGEHHGDLELTLLAVAEGARRCLSASRDTDRGGTF